MEVNNWGVAHALRFVLHHMGGSKLRLLQEAHEGRTSADFHTVALERFGKVRSKVVPALAQIRKIEALAIEKGYADILALLNERLPLDVIPTDPENWFN